MIISQQKENNNSCIHAYGTTLLIKHNIKYEAHKGTSTPEMEYTLIYALIFYNLLHITTTSLVCFNRI